MKFRLFFAFLLLTQGTSFGNPYQIIGDVDGDNHVGLQEAIYALQVVAGIYNEYPSSTSESEPNDSVEQADVMGIGLSNAMINATRTPNDVDYYKFNTSGNRTYTLETYGIVKNAYNDGTGIYLYDSSGNLLADDSYSDNGTNVADARIVFKFIVAGTYFIKVTKPQGDNDWTGLYSLRILPKHDEPGASWDSQNESEPNDTLPLSNFIGIGVSNAETQNISADYLDYCSSYDEDWYYFSAQAGSAYVIETFNLLPNNDANGTAIYLYDKDGQELANDLGYNGANEDESRVTYNFLRDDVYYFKVTRQPGGGNWTGYYSVRVLE